MRARKAADNEGETEEPEARRELTVRSESQDTIKAIMYERVTEQSERKDDSV